MTNFRAELINTIVSHLAAPAQRWSGSWAKERKLKYEVLAKGSQLSDGPHTLFLRN